MARERRNERGLAGRRDDALSLACAQPGARVLCADRVL